MSFEDVPLPTGGQLLVELNLIGWGLVGGTAEGLNAFLAYRDAVAAAGVPEHGALVHVSYERNGVNVGEAWHDSRTDDGRGGGDPGEARRAPAYEIKVDLGKQPASDRLRRLLTALGPEADPAWLTVVRNALTVADRALTPWAADPELLAAQRLIVAQILAIRVGGGAEQMARLLGTSQAIYDHARRGRHMWAMDARAAAALLLAAHVPAACARARLPHEASAAREYRRLLTLAADRLHAGRWEMIGELVVAAVRDGYLGPLGALAARLTAEATGLRDAALAAPPDPLEFAGLLYDAAPPAFAAGWLSRTVREHANVSAAHREELARSEAEADELFLRLCDGLHSQLADWCLGGIWAERAQITAAKARGDADRAWALLIAGEHALRWPRSYRPFLLGEGPAPAVRRPGQAG